MGIPAVSVKKSIVGGAPAINAVDGILAIIASSSTGQNLPPTMLSTQALAVGSFGSGMLPECSVYDINVSGNPVLAVPYAGAAPGPSIAGSYGNIAVMTASDGAAIATPSSQPLLHYDVVVDISQGGTVGSPGVQYTYSVDGGISVLGPFVLPNSGILAIPGTGVSLTLSLTWSAGDTIQVFTERPLGNNADVSAALLTLGNTKLPWEGVLIDCAYSTGTVGLVDTWLAGREANGAFNFAILNPRFLLEPCPTGEAPSVYAAAMIARTGSDASNRLCVCVDGGRLTSLLTGFTTKFPTSLALGAMAMSLTPNIGTDPAYVGNGPVEGFTISAQGNPLDWDEFLYQSLDSQRLTTLRSFATGGPAGTYITDANVLISGGSNIYWLQLLRVLNKACRIAWQVLNAQLSAGVRTVFNTAMGTINIDPRDAGTINHLVLSPLQSGLAGQVTNVGFALNQTDDLTAPKAPIGGEVAVVPKVYTKNFQITAALVKNIQTQFGGA